MAYWTKELGVSKQQLTDAVSAVGKSAEAPRKYLKNRDYPPSYKNQPKKIRDKATEIADEVLRTTGNEGEAIATGLKQARAYFAKEGNKPGKDDNIHTG